MAFKMTREEYLSERLRGKSRKEIAKQEGVSLNSLECYWLKKWGIKDPSEEEIALVDAKRLEAKLPESPADSDSAARIIADKNTFIKEKEVEIERLREQLDSEMRANDEAMRLLNGTKERLNAAEAELQKLQSQPKERKESALASDYPFPVITVTYGLIDFGGNRTDQLLKAMEEAKEYLTEIDAPNVDMSLAVSELYDAGQAFVGLIRKQLEELCVDDIPGTVQRYFDKHNKGHLAKMVGKLQAREANAG